MGVLFNVMFLDHLATDVEHLERLNQLLKEGHISQTGLEDVKDAASASPSDHPVRRFVRTGSATPARHAVSDSVLHKWFGTRCRVVLRPDELPAIHAKIHQGNSSTLATATPTTGSMRSRISIFVRHENAELPSRQTGQASRDKRPLSEIGPNLSSPAGDSSSLTHAIAWTDLPLRVSCLPRARHCASAHPLAPASTRYAAKDSAAERRWRDVPAVPAQPETKAAGRWTVRVREISVAREFAVLLMPAHPRPVIQPLQRQMDVLIGFSSRMPACRRGCR